MFSCRPRSFVPSIWLICLGTRCLSVCFSIYFYSTFWKSKGFFFLNWKRKLSKGRMNSTKSSRTETSRETVHWGFKNPHWRIFRSFGKTAPFLYQRPLFYVSVYLYLNSLSFQFSCSWVFLMFLALRYNFGIVRKICGTESTLFCLSAESGKPFLSRPHFQRFTTET